MTQDIIAKMSPHLHVEKITTPMLVIHGDKDYRVPIGEGLRLWRDLVARAPRDGELQHKFLIFPDENHWILTPRHAKVWYERPIGHKRSARHGGSRPTNQTGPRVTVPEGGTGGVQHRFRIGVHR
jgi:hypothetical protein